MNFIGNTALGRDVTLGQDLHFHFFHSLRKIRNNLSFSGPGSDLFFAIKNVKFLRFPTLNGLNSSLIFYIYFMRKLLL